MVTSDPLPMLTCSTAVVVKQEDGGNRESDHVQHFSEALTRSPQQSTSKPWSTTNLDGDLRPAAHVDVLQVAVAVQQEDGSIRQVVHVQKLPQR
jgi:hypothetical protein